MSRGSTILGCVSTLVVAFAFLLPVAAAPATIGIGIEDFAQLGETVRFNGSPTWGYRPVSVRVAEGGEVGFANVGLDVHTVTSFSSRFPIEVRPGVIIEVPIPDGVFDSSPNFPSTFDDVIFPGATWTLTATGLSPGSYMYFCKLHPWMQAKIVVGEGPETAGADIVDPFFTNGNPRQIFPGTATWGFRSPVADVAQGTVVVFTNNGFFEHTLTSGTEGGPDEGVEFNSGFADDPANYLFPGMTFSVDTSTLSVGDHPYFCDLHPWMRGILRVRA